MSWTLPEIPEADDTPLVRQLVAIIRAQQDCLQQLEDEIARLKGLRCGPVIAPSRLEMPPRKPSDPGRKRPGSDKRSKTAQLTVTEETVVSLVDKPQGSTFKGYEEYVVQELVIKPHVYLFIIHVHAGHSTYRQTPTSHRRPLEFSPAVTSDPT